jgi:hypothetical protein
MKTRALHPIPLGLTLAIALLGALLALIVATGPTRTPTGTNGT